tara:strand:- start:512 stop:922 length:411 start_codon:yes stop_codon:yes gene_type:complete
MAFIKGYVNVYDKNFHLTLFNAESFSGAREEGRYLKSTKNGTEEKLSDETAYTLITFDRGRGIMRLYIPLDEATELLMMANIKGSDELLDLTAHTDPKAKGKDATGNPLPKPEFKTIIEAPAKETTPLLKKGLSKT